MPPYTTFKNAYKTSGDIQPDTNPETSHNRNQVNCIWFSGKMNLFSDNTDELQYLTEELNHESQENGTESKAKLKKITLS